MLRIFKKSCSYEIISLVCTRYIIRRPNRKRCHSSSYELGSNIRIFSKHAIYMLRDSTTYSQQFSRIRTVLPLLTSPLRTVLLRSRPFGSIHPGHHYTPFRATLPLAPRWFLETGPCFLALHTGRYTGLSLV